MNINLGLLKLNLAVFPVFSVEVLHIFYLMYS